LDLVDVNKWKDIKLALLQKQLANGNMEAYKKELEKNIRLSYYNIALAKKKKATADSIYANYSIVDSLIRLKFNEGITDKITLNQSKSILSQNYSKARSAETDLGIALLNLKAWMSYPFNEELSIDPEISLPDYSFAPFDAASTPEYELKQLTTESAKQNWQKAKTAWIPKLSLQSGYSKTGFGDNLSFISNGGWYPSGYVGLKLSVPISSLYKLSPYADRVKISWEQSKLDLDSYVNKKEKEFLEAKLLLEKYKEKLRSSEQDLLLAKENVALTLQKLRDGIIDMSQLKQVQDDLYKLQDEYSDSFLNYITSYINLNYLQSKKQ
jgi:outer membrane protein TolC